MSDKLRQVFTDCEKQKRPAFVAYLMAGYPKAEDTVPTLLALQEGGADILELGIPFTDPIADGPTIQSANQMALDNKINLPDCLKYVKAARQAGVTIPIVLMGYYNPVASYGERNLAKAASEVGANGFIIVDCPPEEAESFRDHCKEFNISYVPLICPTTSDLRVKKLSQLADSFMYCVSMNGITGARGELPPNLPVFIERVKSITNKKHPLAVGFGISNREHFETVGKIADGVVIGSAIIKALAPSTESSTPTPDKARTFAKSITAGR